MLVLPGEVHHLVNLGLCNFVAENAAYADAALMDVQHDTGCLLHVHTKEMLEHKDDEFNFFDSMTAYLDKDVDALWELCDKLGSKFAEEFGADIRGKCTLGSIAEPI